MSGSLLAAVGAAFVVAGGVLAFGQWPHAELRSPTPQSLDVAAASPTAASGSAAQARPLALLPVTTTPRPTSLGRSGVAARRPGQTFSGGPQVVPAAAIAPVPTTQVTPAGTGPLPVPAPASSSANRVADTVTGVTDTAARTVRSVGAALPAASAVTDTVAGATEDVGKLVSGLTGG